MAARSLPTTGSEGYRVRTAERCHHEAAAGQELGCVEPCSRFLRARGQRPRFDSLLAMWRLTYYVEHDEDMKKNVFCNLDWPSALFLPFAASFWRSRRPRAAVL